MTQWYLDTEHPIALDSYDHTDPLIDMRPGHGDSSFNLAFNAKLYQIVPPPLSVLDFGCGAGGFVKTLLDEGVQAVGLEGSDELVRRGMSNLPLIPGNMFTCDLTFPFVLHTGDHRPYLFDVVTAWEFVEHILEKDLPQVFINLHAHLKPDGLFIMSTPSDITHPPRRGLDHHRTRRDWLWWQATIEATGMLRRPDLEAHFGGDWVRHGNVRNVYSKV